MAALAIFQAGAFTSGAELAAIVFALFGHALTGFKRTVAVRMGT
jgi:hypothetical protein